MRAGKLRHFTTIEAPTSGQDKYGEPIEAWGTFLQVWASREDLAGREFFAAQQTGTEVTTRFRMRYQFGITPTMRINADGVLYDIQSVQDPDGKRRETIVMAKRRD